MTEKEGRAVRSGNIRVLIYLFNNSTSTLSRHRVLFFLRTKTIMTHWIIAAMAHIVPGRFAAMAVLAGRPVWHLMPL